MRQTIRTALAGLGTLLLSALASTALAVEIGYTLNGPLPFTAGSATGNINAVSGPVDASFSICLAGTCDLPNQDWLVFDVTVTAGAVNDIRIGALFANAQGIGYFSPPLQPSYTANVAVPSAPNIFFGGGLTGTSNTLFVAYANGALPTSGGGPYAAGSVQFMVAEFGSAALDSPVGIVTTQINIVPEPSTGALLGAGLVLLVLRRRGSAN